MINYNKIFGVDDSYKAPEKIMEIIYNKKEREELFKKMLEVNNYDVSFDWFHEYFQNEHADRKNKKQDFTPKTVAKLLTSLVSEAEKEEGFFYECCVGTGGIMITYWDNFRRKYSPFNYEPCFQYAHVEELSDRAIPFLLINMMVRGMNGVVVHCDVLTRKCKNAYFICNTKNDHMCFSGITNIPHTKFFEQELRIKFENEEYVEHKELMDMGMIEEIVNSNKKVNKK